MTLDRDSAVLEDSDLPSPRPSSEPKPSPIRSLFGFGSSPGEEQLETLLTGPQPDPELGSATEWPSAAHEPQQPAPASGPTTSSLGSAAGSPLSKGQLKETFRAGVRISTSTAHRFGATTPGQQHVGLYLADEDDVKGIADPLAEIAHRRGGVAGGKLSPDANNAMQAVMALAGYIAKQLKGIHTAKVLDGHIASGQVVMDVAGDVHADEEI